MCIVDTRWKMGLISISLAVILCGIAVVAIAGGSQGNPEEAHLYVTYEDICFDRCASAWLIQRFIDKEAKVKFIPVGSAATEGIPFSMPGAKLGHQKNRSAFLNIMEAYGLKDPALLEIGKMANCDIWWATEGPPETKGMIAVVNGLKLTCKNDHEMLEKSKVIFDALYAQLQAKLKPAQH